MRNYGHEHNANVEEAWVTQGGSSGDCPGWSWYAENGGVLGQEPYPEWYVAHVAELLTAGHSALAATGSLWLNVGDTYFARWSSVREEGRQGLGSGTRQRRRTPSGGWRQDKQLLLLPARIAVEMQSRGWILRNDLIWAKPTPPPRPERDRLRLSHEHLFHFVKRRRTGRASYYYDLAQAEPGARDVVVVAPEAGEGGHSATFPSAMIEKRILSSCPEGGTVVDPFCGTGRALAIAARSGRRAIGFELSPRFASIASRNLQAALEERAGHVIARA
jgi:DNA modification methylase